MKHRDFWVPLSIYSRQALYEELLTNTGFFLPLLQKQPQCFVAWIPKNVGNILLRFRSMLRGLHHIISADLSVACSCCQTPVLPHPKYDLLDSVLVTRKAAGYTLSGSCKQSEMTFAL